MNRRDFFKRLSGSAAVVVLPWSKCAYCGRVQIFGPDGGCISCGAGQQTIPEPPVVVEPLPTEPAPGLKRVYDIIVTDFKVNDGEHRMAQIRRANGQVVLMFPFSGTYSHYRWVAVPTNEILLRPDEPMLTVDAPATLFVYWSDKDGRSWVTHDGMTEFIGEASAGFATDDDEWDANRWEQEAEEA